MRDHIVVDGRRCEIELLRRRHIEIENGNPSHEVMAPDGFEFTGGESRLGVNTERDLQDIERGEVLNPVE